MDIGKWTRNLPKWLHKYRYPVVILLIGMVLLTLPGKEKIQTKTDTPTVSTQQPDTGQQLAQILAQIEGVGRVKVMLTVAEGEKTLYQSDESISTGDNSSSVRKETILISDGNRNQQALVTQVLSPKYKGAVVVCQGADIPAVKWAIVEAVSKATGLGADQISVLKMK